MDPKKGKKFQLEIIPATKQKGHKTVVLHNYRKKKKKKGLHYVQKVTKKIY